MKFSLSPGQAHDTFDGEKPLNSLGGPSRHQHPIMDRACEYDRTQDLAPDFGFVTTVPSQSNQLTAWHFSMPIYKRRTTASHSYVS